MTGRMLVSVVMTLGGVGYAQPIDFHRLPPDHLDVLPPSARVEGALGTLKVRDRSCPPRNLDDERLRRRIVDLVAQEWRFFGLSVVDYTRDEPSTTSSRRARRRWSLLGPGDYQRVADSIAGYWTVTPEGAWIIENQNERWRRSGVETRWRIPWSAAFVSWVMCESGLDEPETFRRAVAHHSYIDQAIRARDNLAPLAAFTANDIGETPISPGDLLCSGRRPPYRSVSQRRRQMGEGARTHCDIVVTLDAKRRRILAIGGNVRATVALKLLPAVLDDQVGLRPEGGRRPPFVHLQLRAKPIPPRALKNSSILRTMACEDRRLPQQLVGANVELPPTSHC